MGIKLCARDSNKASTYKIWEYAYQVITRLEWEQLDWLENIGYRGIDWDYAYAYENYNPSKVFVAFRLEEDLVEYQLRWG